MINAGKTDSVTHKVLEWPTIACDDCGYIRPILMPSGKPFAWWRGGKSAPKGWKVSIKQDYTSVPKYLLTTRTDHCPKCKASI